MFRVLGVTDGHTITIDRAGVPTKITLAGIEVTDEARARDLLTWSLASSWVLIEKTDDAALVYRSPDALFMNRELVVRGYARATNPALDPHTQLAVTYLGIIDPAGPQARTEAKPPNAVPARKTGSGTSRRSTSPRSPRKKASRDRPSGG